LVLLAQVLLQRLHLEVLAAFPVGILVLLEADLKLNPLAVVEGDLLRLHPVFLAVLVAAHQTHQQLLEPGIRLQHHQAKAIRAATQQLMEAVVAAAQGRLVETQMLLGHLEGRAAQDLIHCLVGLVLHQLALVDITLAVAVEVLKIQLL
jgi:hypothetical protein